MTNEQSQGVPRPAPFLAPTKTRTEWYQSANFVCLEVFLKNVKKEDVTLNLQSNNLSLSIVLPNSTFTWELDPLQHEIVPEKSGFSVLSTKIEIKLKKLTEGLQWSGLEGVDTKPVMIEPETKKVTKTKNWEAIVQGELKPEDEESGDPLNSLFQKIYKDADEDTKRAMMKSYIESNGTALSTNWNDVSQGKVETTPPDGMIAKKWNE